MQLKMQQLVLDMEQLTGSELGKKLHQGCILFPCLFKFYAEYIMWNARLDESQVGIKTVDSTTDDTALMAESEEELKSFLMSMKA